MTDQFDLNLEHNDENLSGVLGKILFQLKSDELNNNNNNNNNVEENFLNINIIDVNNFKINNNFHNDKIVLQSFGKLCLVKGRLKLFQTNGSSVSFEDFQFSLDEGKTLSISRSDNENIDDIPKFNKIIKNFVIIAKDFPNNVPVDSITLNIINGNYSDPYDINSENKNVTIMRASFTFKSKEQFEYTSSFSYYRNVEILLDTITIFSANVCLPSSSTIADQSRGNNVNISTTERLMSRSSRSVQSSVFSRFKNYISTCLKNIEKSNVSLDVFVLIVVFNIWMIVGSKIFNTTYSYFYFIISSAILFPIILYRLLFINRGAIMKYLKRLMTKKVSNNRSFFVNGWQAWSFCGTVLNGQKPPMYSMPSVCARGFHDGGEGTSFHVNNGNGDLREVLPSKQDKRKLSEKDYIASDMFTALTDLESKCGVVIGYLSQKQQFGCIASNEAYDTISAIVSGDGMLILPSSTIKTDWVSIYQIRSIIDPFKTYMIMSRDENKAKLSTNSGSCPLRSASVPVGWCSWYHFFANISEKDLLNNLDCMKRIKKKNYLESDRLGFNLFQIDDGYQNAWGDWAILNKNTFPKQTLYNIVREIKDADMIGGVWMAPFACDKHSLVAKNHPDWVLKAKGSTTTPSNSGNCGKWFYALDVTNKEVQNHIKENIEVATKIWEFSYLKLDFLYASCLGGVHESYRDRTLSKAQVIQLGMKLIADVAGDNVFILGCGAPLGSVIGYVHANRISSDAGLSWLPEFPLPKSDKWNLPCARNMVRNSICRMFMHSYWWINDPDCMLLRDKLHFSEEELIGILTVKAFSGGTFIISDDLDSVSSNRMKLAMKLLPPTNLAAVPLDLLVREMPEILRLRLTSSLKQEKSDSVIKKINYQGGKDVLELLIDFASELRSKEEDLTDEWIMLAVCNWDEPNSESKTHYLHINDIFDKEQLIQLVKKFQFVQYAQRRKSNEFNNNTNPDIMNIFDNISPVYCLLFLYNFWSETYSNHVVSLNSIDGLSEIEFNNIPHHSAYIYKVGIFDEPTVPKYIGSNLHFSCGSELKKMYITETPLESSNSLKLMFSELASNNNNNNNNNDIPKIRSVCIQFNEGALRDSEWGGFIDVFLPLNSSNSSLGHEITDVIDIIGPAYTNNEKSISISMVAYVDEPKCNIKGSILKIPVSCKKVHLSEKSNTSQTFDDYLIISWIYNVV